jgi:hypothetical protein
MFGFASVSFVLFILIERNKTTDHNFIAVNGLRQLIRDKFRPSNFSSEISY